jgi:hypothetical protein
LSVQPFSLQPAAATSLSVQPLALSLAVVPSGTPPTARGEGTTPTGMELNEALKKLSSQVETLTKVATRHADLLSDHETRIKALEKKTAKMPAAKDGQDGAGSSP